MSVEKTDKVETTVSKEEVEVNKKEVSGAELGGLFKAPSTTVIDVKYKGDILKFEIQPMGNSTFAKIGEKIKPGKVDLDSDTNTLAGFKVISDLYYPAMQAVLPKCCVNPRMVDGVSTDPNVLSIEYIPMPVGIQLVDKILIASGIGGDEEEERKN